jgi:hypothetical protein
MSRAIIALVYTLAITLGLSQVAAAQGPPVIPGGSGFGINTPAGRGGQIMRVTNLNDSGAGSLRACVTASGPRICVFEVSGAIWLSGVLRVNNPNLTIAGQTAPSPGIELRNGGMLITASDVLVRHIRIRVGDDPSGPDFENRDALQVEGTGGQLTQNVVIDHSSISWSTDELSTLYYDWDNVVLLHNIFSEPLNDSHHPEGPHGFGLLWRDAAGKGRVTAVGNIMAHIRERNPRALSSDAVLVNNLVYNATERNHNLETINQAITTHSVVGSIFLDGPTSNRYRKSIDLVSLVNGSKVYLADNVAPESNGTDQWAIVDNNTGVSRQSLEATAPPIWPAGLVAVPTANNVARDWILANAGARPAERDSVDARIVREITNGTGSVINCVSPDGSARCALNGGGWTTLAENNRALVLPNNPNGDDDGDGYTNVEEWLNQMAADLEVGGAPPANSVAPLPPTDVRISEL